LSDLATLPLNLRTHALDFGANEIDVRHAAEPFRCEGLQLEQNENKNASRLKGSPPRISRIGLQNLSQVGCAERKELFVGFAGRGEQSYVIQ
jgi:hypothetical protein